MAFVVKEQARIAVPHISFGASLRALPARFRQFLAAVFVFGIGDFAHSLLILLAMQALAPALGVVRAASLAAGLYVLHNLVYAGTSMIAGSLADRIDKKHLLAAGYGLGALMALTVIVLPLNLATLAAVFVIGGVYLAMEETLEDSFCAELIGRTQHGMAFGTLAAVNGVGDFVSSIILGLLWTTFGTATAFGYSAILFIAGSLMVLMIAPPDKLS
jgi:MFS family permease